jgi:hypothetical protein
MIARILWPFSCQVFAVPAVALCGGGDRFNIVSKCVFTLSDHKVVWIPVPVLGPLTIPNGQGILHVVNQLLVCFVTKPLCQISEKYKRGQCSEKYRDGTGLFWGKGLSK